MHIDLKRQWHANISGESGGSRVVSLVCATMSVADSPYCDLTAEEIEDDDCDVRGR